MQYGGNRTYLAIRTLVRFPPPSITAVIHSGRNTHKLLPLLYKDTVSLVAALLLKRKSADVSEAYSPP